MKLKDGSIVCSKCWGVYTDPIVLSNGIELELCGQCKQFHNKNGRLLKKTRFHKDTIIHDGKTYFEWEI